MTWQIVEDEKPGYGPVRITTKGYGYSLMDAADRELWAFHWHPEGPSPERKPHLHLGSVILSDTSPFSNKAHLPIGRVTFENAIRWVFQSGVAPAHGDWDSRLALAEAPHLLYRSWGVDPDRT